LIFCKRLFCPVIHRLGPRIEIRLEKYGFYPAGGGRLAATVEPRERLSSICLLERGEIDRRAAVAIVANLPRSIAQREMDTIAKLLNWNAGLIEVVETRDSAGPGISF
jgi:RNA 3'-terminal phosphate cyclase (ATP)